MNEAIRKILLEETDIVRDSLYNNIGYRIGYNLFKTILSDGIDYEILEPGAKGWQKGKMRL